MCKINNITKKITTNGYFVKNNKDQGCYQANIYNNIKSYALQDTLQSVICLYSICLHNYHFLLLSASKRFTK